MADGQIKIEIEVDGKQVNLASKELDRLQEAGLKSSKGIKVAESGMDSLSDKSTKAGSSVKGAGNAIDDLGASGSKAGKDLKGADSAIDGLAGSSSDAAKNVKGTSDSLDDMSSKAGEAANSAKKVKEETDGVGQTTGRASIGIKELATSLGLVAIASAAFNTLKSSLDSAIARFDTLNTFPGVLQALGVSAEESERAMQKLGDGIDGLPTTLNDIALNAQNMYSAFGDMDKAADMAIALNNALLGSGSSAAEAQRGVDMYMKILNTGKVDMMTWNSLNTTMSVGLTKLADEFGYTGASAKNDLYKALQDGVIPMSDFHDKLIELGTGTGILADLAKKNSLGIATSLGNLKNAASRGIANIIASFNKLSEDITGKDIAQNIDSLKVIVNSSFKVIGSVIEGTAPYVRTFASAVQSVLPVVQALSPALIGLASAYAIHTVVNMATTAIKTNTTVIAIATVAKKAYEIATNRLTLAMTLAVVQTKIMGVALAAYNGIVAAAVAVQALLTSGMSLATVGVVALSGAISVLGTVINILMGPVGWVTLAIGALVGAVIGIVKWFNRASEEGKRMSKATEELSNSIDSLNSSVDESSKAYKDNQTEINASAKANADLAKRIEDLAAKENKSVAEKMLLKSYIEQLNGSVEGLNLAYDEEANKLSMSSEQLKARIKLMQDQEAAQAGQERLLEISKEQREVDMKLAETNELRADWNQKLADGSVKASEHKTAIAELDEQEAALTETNAQLAEQQKETEEQITASMEAVTEAIQSGVRDQIISFDSLSDSHKKTIENMREAWVSYLDSATDMFDKISTKSEISAQDMQKNLEHNQKVISDWADNIAKLAERGVDQGLLDTLRDAGPESAGHVIALVNATDTELAKLSETFAKGADVATNAFTKGLDVDESGVMSAIGHFVTGAQLSLREQIESAQFNLIGTDLAEGVAEGVEGGTPQVVKASGEMMKSAEEAARKESETHSPSKVFERIGDDLTGGLALGVSNGTTTVINTAKKLIVDFIAQFNDLRSEFEAIGKDAMAGFERGLKNGEARVLATAKSIADSVIRTTKAALDIHSPSRAMKQIGLWTGEGLAIGLDQSSEKVNKAMSDIGDGILAVSEAYQKEYTNLIDDFNKKNEDKNDKTLEKIYKIRNNAAKKKRKLTKKELQDIALLEAEYRESKLKAERDFDKKYKALVEKSEKEYLQVIKNYIADKKSLDELSLAEEAAIWDQSIELFVEGSKERIAAQKEYKNSVEAINKELTSINKQYSDEMKSIIENATKQEEEWTKAYEKTLEDRKKALMSFAGTFDEFKVELNRTGAELMGNLQDQVDGFKFWQEEFEKLSARNIDSDLLSELSDLGVKALPELVALNSMTDEQLSQYSELYREKSQLAREQAEKELEGMKKDTDKKILELRQVTESQLNKLQTEWHLKIKNLTATTASELSTLRQIGEDAGQGLLDGLASMEGPLVDKAIEIADGIKGAIQSALDIHSPSRWMRDFVAGNMAKGFVDGVDKNKSLLTKASERFSDIIKPTPITGLAGSKAMQNVSNTTSNNYDIDRSRTMHTQVTVQSQDDKVAYERMMRRLVFEFGI